MQPAPSQSTALECDIDPLATSEPFPETGDVLNRIPKTSEWINHPLLRAQGRVIGAGTHIGGGFFTGHNHAHTGYENPTGYSRNGLLYWALPDQTTIHATGKFTYKARPESQIYADLHHFHVPDPKDAPAIPMIVFADPNDIIGQPAINVGWPPQGSVYPKAQRTYYFSTGNFTEVHNFINTITYVSRADTAIGFSGSGVFTRFDADGDSTTETFAVGAQWGGGGTGLQPVDVETGEPVSRPGFAVRDSSLTTAYTTNIYQKTASDMAKVGIEAADVPCYTLMSGFDADAAVHEVNGTQLRERLVGGSHHDTLNGAGGDDLLIGDRGDPTGATGDDTFVIANDGGHDVIRDFNLDHDQLDVSGLDYDHIEVIETPHPTDPGGPPIATTVVFDQGDVRVTLEGLSGTDVLAALPRNEVTVGVHQRDRWRDSSAIDVVTIGTQGATIVAGLFAGDNRFDTSGNSNSTLTYRDAPTGVNLDARASTAVTAHGTDTWAGNWRRIEGSQHDDQIFGGGGRNVIATGRGNDVVNARSGNDKIILTDGIKQIHGGRGSDEVRYVNSPAAIHLYDAADPRHTDAMSTFVSIERVFAGAGATTISIGANTDVRWVYGGAGNDTFRLELGDLTMSTTRLHLRDFRPASEALYINGQAIDITNNGANLPTGFTLRKSKSGIRFLTFGDDDRIVLGR